MVRPPKRPERDDDMQVMSNTRDLFRILLLLALAGCNGGGSDGDDGGNGSGNPQQPPAATEFPLRASGDGRRVEDQNGKPFLMVGDAAWSAAVVLDAADIETYLDGREQRGFNTILVNAIEHGFNGSCTPGVDCWNNANGDAPFTTMTPDVAFDDPNPDYWSHFDTLLDEAEERGILVLLTPGYIGFLCSAEGWADEMANEADDAEMQAYGEFLGQRYRDQDNLVWVLGGDSHPADAGCPANLIDRINALEAGIAAGGASQLRTAHDRRGYSARDRYGTESWLDLGSTYSGCFGGDGGFEPSPDAFATALRTKDDFDAAAGPFFYIEGRYENEGASLECLLSQAWWAVLGGATGQVFGNNPVWLFDPGWPAELGSDGSRAMEVLAKVMASRPWQDLVPDYAQTTVISGRGDITERDYVAAGRTPDGSLAMVWVPTAGAITVDMTRIAGANANVWVVDATDGSVTLEGTFPTTGDRAFGSSGLELFVIDDAALGLPAPGS